MDEIEKITKESSSVKNNKKKSSERRKGYIGLSIGPSIPVGDFAEKSNGMAKTGLQINLINFAKYMTKIHSIS